MALYGVGLNVAVERIILDLKLHIAKSNQASLKNLQRIFEKADANGNHRLSLKEFEKALANFGFFPKVVDLQALLKHYDTNGDGQIDFDEFIVAVREPLNERRRKLVDKAWRKLDPDHSGWTNVRILYENFNGSKDKQVIEKKKTSDEVFEDFLGNFDKVNKADPNSRITNEEFVSHYTDLGVAIPSDNYFSELLQGTWNIEEDKESTISVNEIKDIIKTLRYKLIQRAKNGQDESLLRKLFKDFDLNKSGYLTLDELQAMMIRLECPVHINYLAAVFSFIDQNKSGYIEFEEFANLVINDPFP